MPNNTGRPADWYEPPDPGPECLWCSGSASVDVASIIDAGSNRQSLRDWQTPPEIQCPRCDGTGVEPRPIEEG